MNGAAALKCLPVNTGWHSYTRHQCCSSSPESDTLPPVLLLFSFGSDNSLQRHYTALTPFTCMCLSALLKLACDLGVVVPTFHCCVCVWKCFHPPDGTPPLLNEDARALQSDEHHPSKTSCVPHPKFSLSDTVQQKTPDLKVHCISSV